MTILRIPLLLCLLLVLPLGACQSAPKEEPGSSHPAEPAQPPEGPAAGTQAPTTNAADTGSAERAVAIFAGGCFWCMEKPFESIEGVFSVVSGFTAGPEDNPTYKQVANGLTGHTEAVEITYDPSKVSYELLLEVFWRNINPTQKDGQFVDRGPQYRSGIYFANDAERDAALKSKAALEASKRFDSPIVTEIEKAGPFFPAEDYHQDFYKKSAAHYQRYRSGSGRDAYLTTVWGDEAGGYTLHGAAH